MAFEQTLPPIEQIVGPPDSDGRTPWGYADMAMAIGIVIGGTILLALAAVGLRLPERGGWWLPLAMLGGALMVIWVFFAVIAALGVEPRSNIPDEVFDSVPLTVLMGILALALAPFMEEVFFRGFLFGGLRGRWGVFFAEVSTGLLFPLAPVEPLVFVPFTVVGMIFALGYVYSGSILAIMIAHLLFNAISFGLAASGVAR